VVVGLAGHRSRFARSATHTITPAYPSSSGQPGVRGLRMRSLRTEHSAQATGQVTPDRPPEFDAVSVCLLSQRVDNIAVGEPHRLPVWTGLRRTTETRTGRRRGAVCCCRSPHGLWGLNSPKSGPKCGVLTDSPGARQCRAGRTRGPEAATGRRGRL
jgi:hypothetical protein